MYVTEHLHEFVKRYPKLRVHLVTGNHLLDLLENGFDVVMHCGELPNSSFHYKKLGKTKEIAVSGNACVNSSIDLVNLAISQKSPSS